MLYVQTALQEYKNEDNITVKISKSKSQSQKSITTVSNKFL